ncbi:DNA polymerase IV [Methylobrevis albus]|uniref:DNA polymerase IV n=1 Tax=Methylobrevis albus TaxID=2793297 RepID=A0A931HZN9_9HYPH|nr:DNA polymerase IV [Methylobrevis albus]MBH0236581.1 DNA polymerase IV [Methylobrevis albus]
MSTIDPAQSSGGFCRDCLTPASATVRRCTACGSPRLLRHPELDRLTIAHVDCDAFYAAIEKRDDPALRDKPLIIGGGRRGVVSTCCYIARIRGVRSAMPMFKALEACPDAVVIKPNMAKYVEVGRAVRAMMLDLTPLVEPLSIDEAFLDLGGTERLHKAIPALVLARFAAKVEAELGITVSVGLSVNKFLAKIASDLDKPRGYAVIGGAEAKSFLAGRPVGAIWGVGKAMQARLAADGLRTIGELQALPERDLARRYGAMGLRLARLSHGVDPRKVSPDHQRKSVSAETTFDDDLAALADLRPVARRLAEKVSKRLKADGIAGWTVTLKLKTHDFRILTRSRRLADPTQLADRMFQTVEDLLRKEVGGLRYRLIGVGISDLVAGDQADPVDLVDPGIARRAAAERAMDKVRARFGGGAVETGLVFTAPGRRKPE